MTVRIVFMLSGFVIVQAAGAAWAEPAPSAAPAPAAQSATPPPQPAAKPALNLRLNDRDLRSIPDSPKESAKKQDVVDSLPGLGGKPSDSWSQPVTPAKIVPESNPY
ncbi:MAG TPA: hypothetical protein VI321_09880 [Burkholderiales bacterium]